MRIHDDEHLALPWRVHELAADFDLLDVWRLPVEGDLRSGHDLRAFAEQLRLEDPPSGVTGLLFRLRLGLGRVLGWDEQRQRPIPGCTEHSVAARLPAELRARVPPADPARQFQVVYSLPRERLLEISNSTVHALMHLGWVERPGGVYAAQMAVYCKPRGRLGRLYMALITPFRLFIVYPALMRHIGARWSRRVGAVPAAGAPGAR